MLTIHELSLQRGGQWLLERASATLQPGQRVAVIGANGAGKSSLFQLILGRLDADAGSIRLPGGCRIAHMAQEVAASDRSARDYVLDGHQPLRTLEAALAQAEQAQDDHAQARLHGELDALEAWALPRRAESLLRGLGFSDADIERPVRSFSGGWRIRLNLAQALMQPSDLLLLDEPTNHLDLDACVWLEQWLRRYPGTLLFISHDRDFMDRVATHVLHFDQRNLQQYTGNYSAFEAQRAERLAQQAAAFTRQQQQVAQIQRFIDRFKAQATKARQAQSRMKALERMERIAPAHVDSPFEFEFPCAPKMSSPLLALRDAAVGHGGTPLLKGLTLTLLPGSRIGLLGANGAGKSTLLAALRGALPLLQGTRTTGEHLAIGYFAQHQLEALDLDASPLLHIQRLSPEVSEQVGRNFLGGFGFHGDDAVQPIRHFSGGEKARLALALVAWCKPNLLLLDEPTNHLDLEMRQALTMALQTFEGAIVLVSHDRHLLRNSVDEFWLVSEGRVQPFDGDLDDYERLLDEQRRRQDTDTPSRGGESAATTTATAEDRKARKRAEAELRQRLAPQRRRLEALEKEMARLQAHLASLDARLGDNALYEPARKAELSELLRDQARDKAQLESVEMEWLVLSEDIEQQLATG